MLVRIPHHNCEQSGALRICVPKLEFGNMEQKLFTIDNLIATALRN